MKWRERNEWRRNQWHQGPENTYYTARKGGKVYEVHASWRSWSDHSAGVVWWSHDGQGTNKAWKTRGAAMRWCERDAGVPEDQLTKDPA